MEISLERNETTLFFFIFLGGWLFHFEKKKKTHIHYITFHKTYSNNGDISWQLRVLSDESCRYAPSDFACPRASGVQSKQGSRYGNHYATPHGTSRRIGTITWDIAANRHHYEQSKLCHMQLSQNDWLHVIRSCVSIQQNCQEARQELCRNFCAVDRLSCGKLSNRNHKCGPQRDAILLTHRQVFPFDIIIMYMRTKYTRLLSIICQYSFPWCKNYGPRTVPISFWLYNPVGSMYDIRMYRRFPTWDQMI